MNGRVFLGSMETGLFENRNSVKVLKNKVGPLIVHPQFAHTLPKPQPRASFNVLPISVLHHVAALIYDRYVRSPLGMKMRVLTTKVLPLSTT